MQIIFHMYTNQRNYGDLSNGFDRTDAKTTEMVSPASLLVLLVSEELLLKQNLGSFIFTQDRACMVIKIGGDGRTRQNKNNCHSTRHDP